MQCQGQKKGKETIKGRGKVGEHTKELARRKVREKWRRRAVFNGLITGLVSRATRPINVHRRTLTWIVSATSTYAISL